MYGIDRFSKNAVIQHFSRIRENNLKECGLTSDSMEQFSAIDPSNHSELGRANLLGKLINEIQSGAIVSEKGRFTEKALLDRMEKQLIELEGRNQFDAKNGWSQVENATIDVRKDYSYYWALKFLCMDCS